MLVGKFTISMLLCKFYNPIKLDVGWEIYNLEVNKCSKRINLKKENNMISPTGLGIRKDSEGDGNYGASRGSRKHNGIDYLCKKGQNVIAPFNMYISRISKPKANCSLSGIKWKSGTSNGRMFYFQPDLKLIGKHVTQGTVIGVAQSVSEFYKLPKMQDHIHFQIN